jgi:hypothetical protein
MLDPSATAQHGTVTRHRRITVPRDQPRGRSGSDEYDERNLRQGDSGLVSLLAGRELQVTSRSSTGSRSSALVPPMLIVPNEKETASDL